MLPSAHTDRRGSALHAAKRQRNRNRNRNRRQNSHIPACTLAVSRKLPPPDRRFDHVSAIDVVLPASAENTIPGIALKGHYHAVSGLTLSALLAAFRHARIAGFGSESRSVSQSNHSDPSALSAHRGMGCAFALARGVLTLALDKAAYERAGLQGRASKCSESVFCVEIDLGRDGFFPPLQQAPPPQKKKHRLYDRVAWCFANTLADVRFDAVLTGVSSDDCLSALQQSKITQHALSVTSTPLRSLLRPHIPREKGRDFALFADRIHEYTSLVAMQVPRVFAGDRTDEYVSGYRVPFQSKNPSLAERHATLVRIEGLISREVVDAILAAVAQSGGDPGDDQMRWASVCGAEESCTGWSGRERASFGRESVGEDAAYGFTAVWWVGGDGADVNASEAASGELVVFSRRAE